VKGKDKEEAANPLVQGGVKLIPSVTRVFRRSQALWVYLQAYEQGAETTRPMIAFVTLYRDHRKVYETQPMEVKDAWNNRVKTMPLRFDLSLGALAPGQYDCQVTVLDPSGQKAVFWQAPVQIVP
jgi:hypothetical protein